MAEASEEGCGGGGVVLHMEDTSRGSKVRWEFHCTRDAGRGMAQLLTHPLVVMLSAMQQRCQGLKVGNRSCAREHARAVRR